MFVASEEATSPILKEAKDKVRFFLGEISSIDKDGAASWAELLTTLAEKSSIEFEEVNYILLEEGCRNLEIFAHGEVVSFYLDLECEPCQKISSIKFSSAEAAEAALEKSGLFVCEVCNGQLDVIVEGIPAFLDYLKAQ